MWIKSKNMLLCSELTTWSPYLLDLENKSREDHVVLSTGYGFVDINNTNYILYGKTVSKFPFGESYNIYIYDYYNKKEFLIVKDEHMSCGVWVNL